MHAHGELARSLNLLTSFDQVAWSRPELDVAAIGQVDREKHSRGIRRDRVRCAGRAYRHGRVASLILRDAVLSNEDGVTLDGRLAVRALGLNHRGAP